MNNFYAYELSSAEHNYKYKHLCTPKTRQMKMRVGIVCEGKGVFTYINQKLTVNKGDIVIIPERIFCYSEWTGSPDIRIIYLSFKLNLTNSFSGYSLQAISPESNTKRDEAQKAITEIHSLLTCGDRQSVLKAYGKFYMLLSKLLPAMDASRKKYSKELCEAISYITDNWNTDFCFSDVAAHCCSCESKLYSLFKEQFGQSPNNYLNSIKINYAIQYLENSKFSVSETARQCNFHSESYFRKVFRKLTGINPSDYKKRFLSL